MPDTVFVSRGQAVYPCTGPEVLLRKVEVMVGLASGVREHQARRLLRALAGAGLPSSPGGCWWGGLETRGFPVWGLRLV